MRSRWRRCCSTFSPATRSSCRRSRSSRRSTPSCCAARARLRRHPARHAQPGRAPGRAVRSRRAPRRSWRCTTPASGARWTRSWQIAARTASPSSRTTRTGCSDATADGRSERSASLATLSFHETKNFTCGEGGALLVNDARLRRSAPRSCARRARTGAGSSAARSTSTPGSTSARATCRPSCWPPFCSRNSSCATRSRRSAAASASATRTRLALGRGRRRHAAAVPPHCEQAYHMFYMLLPDLERASALHRAPEARGRSRRLPLPAAASAAWAANGTTSKGHRPVTELVSDQLVRLPFFTSLTTTDQHRVIDAVLSFQP